MLENNKHSSLMINRVKWHKIELYEIWLDLCSRASNLILLKSWVLGKGQIKNVNARGATPFIQLAVLSTDTK
jgi:hypothetical protein